LEGIIKQKGEIMADKVCMHTKAMKDIENGIRDIINMVAVWKTEEQIDSKAAKELEAKLRKIAEKLGVETL
jgi:hypothetical protein